MKILLFLIFTIAIIYAEVPTWYASGSLTTNKPSEVIGTAEAKTCSEAKAIALDDIASQLKSEVSSTLSSNVKSNNTRDVSYSVKASSHAILYGVETLRKEENDGRCFLALQYDNISVVQRLARRYKNKKCEAKILDPYLNKTRLSDRIEKRVGCRLGFDIVREDGVWQLVYDDFRIPISKDEFEDLFVSVKSKYINFESSKNTLYDGDEFNFTLSAKSDGYITLLSVYENGIVTLFMPSMKIKKGKTIHFPSEDSDQMLEAGLVTKGVDTYDLYVAIFSKEPINTSRFEYASSELEESESAYKFDELKELINKHNFSSIYIRTKAK